MTASPSRAAASIERRRPAWLPAVAGGRAASPAAAPAALAGVAAVLFGVAAAAPAAGVETAAPAVDLRLSGRMVFHVHYDTDQMREGIDFATYLTKAGEDEVNFNPRDTRLGLSARTAEGDWSYQGVFEIDFYGANAGNNLVPRLRLGYAQLSHRSGFSLRTGQDWIPIAQQNSGMVDFGNLAWAGNLWWRVPQVTARRTLGDLELLASVMKHRVSSPQEIDEKMPWLCARAAWSGLQGGRGLLAIGYAARAVTLQYEIRDDEGTLIGRDESEYAPWLLVGEYRVALGQRSHLSGEAWVGQAFGREFMRYDLDYNPSVRREIQAWGGFAGLAFDVAPRLQLNIGYGIDDPRDSDLTGWGGAAFRKNQAVYGNAKYQVSKQYGMGVEVVHFATDRSAHETIEGERFTTGWWFIF